MLYHKNINESPRGRHHIAMSNYFSISMGFINNNFDFWHPQTYCLNPQYQPTSVTKENFGYWSYSLKNPTGITSIDFPIHQYFIAIIMKYFNTTEYFIFRGYMLILSLIGLFFLFLSARELSNSFLFSYTLTISVFLSPTFSFFANSYLINTASLSLFFVGFYFYVKSLTAQNNTNYLLFNFFLTISVLTRFPLIIFLIAHILNLATDKFIFKKKGNLKIIASFASLIVIVSYFLYNKLFLSSMYGSIFLSSANIPKSITDFFSILVRVITHKSWYYGTIIHYLLFFFALFIILKKRKKIKKDLILNSNIRYIGIATLGVLAFTTLSLGQFAYHDYYFLDTYLPLIILFFIASYKHLKRSQFYRFKNLWIPTLIAMLILNLVTNKFDGYYRSNKPLELSRIRYQNGYKTLDSLNISKNAKLLIFNAKGSNSPLLSFRRKGFCIVNDAYQKTSLKNLSNWKYDYIITQNFSFNEDVLKSYPNLNNETSVLYSNDKFTIHTKK